MAAATADDLGTRQRLSRALARPGTTCDGQRMKAEMSHDPATIEAWYRETLRLADQARGWFDGAGRRHRAGLPLATQAEVAMESLRITARLAAAMAWLVDGGRGDPPSLLGEIPPPLPDALAHTPGGAVAVASRRLAATLAAQGPVAARAGPQALP